jgi:cysteine desulfurase
VIDLDHNATTPIRPEVRAAVVEAWRVAAGNPSSLHGPGRAARAELERARRRVAEHTDADPLGVTFTSGGTEANALGIGGARPQGHAPEWILSTPIEHASVKAAVARVASGEARLFEVTPEPTGEITAAAISDALEGLDSPTGPGVVALTVSNAELGNLLDVDAIVGVVRSRAPAAWVHLDAVQAFGKIDVSLRRSGADSIAISGHKIGGPRGTGALIHAPSASLRSLWSGGAQERGRRPGTENTSGLIGFGVAAELAAAERAQARAHMAALRERLIAGLIELPGAHVEGTIDRNVGNTVFVTFDGCLGEVLMMSLDLEGFAVSTGSACSVGGFRPSPVLLGLGRGDLDARRALRFSVGSENTPAEIDGLLAVLPGVVQRARESAA